MFNIPALKRILCLSILICLFLPLCQCSQKAAPRDAAQVREHSEDSDFVVIMSIAHGEPPGPISLLPFVWPLVGLLAARRIRRKVTSTVLSTVELSAATASFVYIVQIIRFWGIIRYGGFIVLTSYALYAVANSAELIRQFRPGRANTRTEK